VPRQREPPDEREEEASGRLQGEGEEAEDLAFQVPRVMKMMHPGGTPSVAPATASTTTSTTSTSPTPGLSTPTTPEGDGSASGGASLITSAESSANEGQLTSFSRFESKDPFQQQVDESTTVASTAEPAPGSTSGAGTPGLSSSGGSSRGSSSGAGAQPAPGAAVISVNGTLMSVPTGSDFPAATPLFHLISVTPSTAKISIAGGSYSNGAASVTLHVNKPVTLMNTADGTRYKVILKPQGTPVAAESAPAGGSTTTSTTPTSPTTPSP
jgi:hypothetical protein